MAPGAAARARGEAIGSRRMSLPFVAVTCEECVVEHLKYTVAMRAFVIKLWGQPEGRIASSQEIQAPGDVEAAALGLKEFAGQGIVWSKDDKVDVVNKSAGTTQPMVIKDVLDWLKTTDAGRNFATRENLKAL